MHLYRRQLSTLLLLGQYVSVRNRGTIKDTLEFLNVATVFRYPERMVHIVPGRRWNPFLALSESLWVLAGRDDVAALTPYNKNILQFSDDGVKMSGAYGERIADQIENVIQRLQADPNDRRAQLLIWRIEDLTTDSNDPPCNSILTFKLRNGRLHLTIYCRSNDIHWGLYAINQAEFSFLLQYIAARLGVKIGIQTHISNSLHLYKDGPAHRITRRMMDEYESPLPRLPKPGPLFKGLLPHDVLIGELNQILDGYMVQSQMPFLEFASDFLAVYRCGYKSSALGPDWVRHCEMYPDWVMAGRAFMKAIGR
jgi:thymidylate synthase